MFRLIISTEKTEFSNSCCRTILRVSASRILFGLQNSGKVKLRVVTVTDYSPMWSEHIKTAIQGETKRPPMAVAALSPHQQQAWPG